MTIGHERRALATCRQSIFHHMPRTIRAIQVTPQIHHLPSSCAPLFDLSWHPILITALRCVSPALHPSRAIPPEKTFLEAFALCSNICVPYVFQANILIEHFYEMYMRNYNEFNQLNRHNQNFSIFYRLPGIGFRIRLNHLSSARWRGIGLSHLTDSP